MKKEYRDLSEREIKVKHIQIDMHEAQKREKQNEIDRLTKEIEQDIPNNKHRLEVRKLSSDIELFDEVISQWKKEVREKKELVQARK